MSSMEMFPFRRFFEHYSDECSINFNLVLFRYKSLVFLQTVQWCWRLRFIFCLYTCNHVAPYLLRARVRWRRIINNALTCLLKITSDKYAADCIGIVYVYRDLLKLHVISFCYNLNNFHLGLKIWIVRKILFSFYIWN